MTAKRRNVLDLAASLSSGEAPPLDPGREDAKEELERVLDFAEGLVLLLRRELPEAILLQEAPAERPPFPWEGCGEVISLEALALGLERVADYRAAQALQHLELAESMLAAARKALEGEDSAAAQGFLAEGLELLGIGLSHGWKYLGLRNLLHGRGGLL